MLVTCRYWCFLNQPTFLYCDNKIAIQIIRNSVFHEQTKQIEINCHVTWHHYQFSIITLLFVPYSLQIVDIFTNMHFTSHFHFLFGKLSILLAAVSLVWREMLKYIYLFILVLFPIISMFPISSTQW